MIDWMVKRRFSASLLAGALVIICLHHSCREREAQVADPDLSEQRTAARELAEQLPTLRFIDSSKGNDRTSGALESGAFDFADAPDGISFSSTADIAFEQSADGGVIVVDINSLRGGGGSAIAGSESYHIDVAFCFSAENDPLEMNEEILADGISGVVGLVGVGDIASIEDVRSFEDQLTAVVYYIVFEDKAQGTYQVVSQADEGNVYRKAFALVLDVRKEKFYVSSRGRLIVAANSMTFDGHYYELLVEDEEHLREVAGLGTLSCL